MRAAERALTLRDGTICALRSPEPRDAGQRIALIARISGETRFMARGTADSPGDAELVADLLADQLEDDAAMEIAAFVDGRMIACGSIGPVARAYPRKRHRAQVGLGVRMDWWGMGIGAAVLRTLVEAAPALGFSQVELSVAEDNHRARRLYGRMGFVEMGRVPEALRYEDGGAADEIWMVRKV